MRIRQSPFKFDDEEEAHYSHDSRVNDVSCDEVKVYEVSLKSQNESVDGPIDTHYNSRTTSVASTGNSQMAPMFVFLSSSLNVELVYSILKGVTSFGYITLLEASNPLAVRKIKQIVPTRIGKSMRITLDKIKIKDQSLWN